MYPYATTPKADAAAIICGKTYRITVLTPRLFRVEYNPNGYFEDRATQTVINRKFSVPAFAADDTETVLTIKTDAVTLRYDKAPFSADGLTVSLNGSDILWHYNPQNPSNLNGTARTLDRIDGPCALEQGILSRNGEPTVLDDSASLLIEETGNIVPRNETYTDQYLFCYGLPDGDNDHKAAIKAFFELTGKAPLIPRYAFGNWWSRYYAYSQAEYAALMKRFKDEGIPFSVAVLDIDWHLREIERKYGTGWSGYTWNEDLFPDHKAFLDHLHNEGFKVSLNLHPDEGIAAHEKPYKQMAEAMGIDPETEETVTFDIANPRFIENYFKILHHPLEDEGVDFWWIDWQQGTTSSIPGLDPLWMLNHFHTLDNRRRGKRPLIFSRYAGAGSHRYPLGFSGDAIITWESLKFQPYFTATASNIGFSWWSHDIGGHMWGARDSELYTRWVQLGVFSPINRLHSTCSRFMNKEPWYYDKNTEFCLKKFLKLRHELIPYLYTMNYLTHTEGEPLVQPLYYNYKSALGDEKPEYTLTNEYTFGTQMLVSPITAPADSETVCGCAETYFPKGMWYDFFTHNRYCGEKVLQIYRTAENMPVFVKAGGIIPLAVTNDNSTDNPETLRVQIFAGESNTFTLYEDDGETEGYLHGDFALTKMDLSWGEKPCFTVHRPQGAFKTGVRNFVLEFIGINETTDVSVTENGTEKPCNILWENGVLTICAEKVNGELTVQFGSAVSLKANDILANIEAFLCFAEMDNRKKDEIYTALLKATTSKEQLEVIHNAEVSDSVKNALSEFILAEL